MKRMYRLLVSLILVMALLLAGCGGKQEEVSGKITPNETEAAVEENPVSLGRIEGGVYTNAYAGFGCKLDANWVYYGAEELQELPDDVRNQIEGSEMGEAMEGYPQIFDMQAENVNDLTGMNVVYTKVGMQERLAYSMLNEEQEIDAALEQKDMMVDAYAQAGIEVQSMEKVKVTFLGEEHYALYTVAQTQGVAYYMLQINNYDAGAYGVTLTVSSFLEDKTEDVLNLFYKAE